MSQIAADAVLVAHFVFVAFVVGGLGAIWLGAALGWHWIRDRRFRLVHLAAIAFVAGEALLGLVCPLTAWEDALRGRPTQASFIARIVHRVMYYALPEWVFTLAYVSFALLVALTLWLVPPARRRQGPRRGA